MIILRKPEFSSLSLYIVLVLWGGLSSHWRRFLAILGASPDLSCASEIIWGLDEGKPASFITSLGGILAKIKPRLHVKDAVSTLPRAIRESSILVLVQKNRLRVQVAPGQGKSAGNARKIPSFFFFVHRIVTATQLRPHKKQVQDPRCSRSFQCHFCRFSRNYVYAQAKQSACLSGLNDSDCSDSDFCRDRDHASVHNLFACLFWWSRLPAYIICS
jgi:hypothetical protein